MLRAYALAELFESNLDSTTVGIMLTTTGGNLIGLSPQMPPLLVKRLSVLGALTWRFYAAAAAAADPQQATSSGASTSLSSSHGASVPKAPTSGPNNNAAAFTSRGVNDRPAALPVFRIARGCAEGGLRELVVECDGRICAFEYAREGLLVGAVSVELDGRKGGGAMAGMNGSLGGGNGADGANENGNNEQEVLEESDAEGDVDRSQQKERLVRLLGIKASAMADYLREELKDFKMPTGLE